MGDALRHAFDTIDAAKPDTRTTAQRVADVLAESHREDTSADFRLGLLQGALAVALPELLASGGQDVRLRISAAGLLAEADAVAAAMSTKRRTKPKTKRSRRNA